MTIFRTRLREDVGSEYADLAAQMAELACRQPGYVDHKTFTAEDGERVTVVTFADRASHDGWAGHPEHVRAQAAGRDRLYAAYTTQVAEVTRERRFDRG